VKVHWQICIIDDVLFKSLPPLELLDLSHNIYLVMFKYTPKEYLELFLAKDIDFLHLEEVVIR
jgi:hypothetical protein